MKIQARQAPVDLMVAEQDSSDEEQGEESRLDLKSAKKVKSKQAVTTDGDDLVEDFELSDEDDDL